MQFGAAALAPLGVIAAAFEGTKPLLWTLMTLFAKGFTSLAGELNALAICGCWWERVELEEEFMIGAVVQELMVFLF